MDNIRNVINFLDNLKDEDVENIISKTLAKHEGLICTYINNDDIKTLYFCENWENIRYAIFNMVDSFIRTCNKINTVSCIKTKLKFKSQIAKIFLNDALNNPQFLNENEESNEYDENLH